MKRTKVNSTDVGAEKMPEEKETLPVVLPTGVSIEFFSTAVKRKRRRQRKATLPADG